MKVVLHCMVIVIAAAIGCGVGFLMRSRALDQSRAGDSRALAAEAAMGIARMATSSKSRVDDSPLATQLQQNLASSVGVTRWLFWLEALEKAAPADFPRLYRLAKDNKTAMRFLAARWTEIAPNHLFDWLVASVKSGNGFPDEEVEEALFKEWPKRDPEAAIKALTEVKGLGVIDQFRDRVAFSILSEDVERGMRLFADWNIENVGIGPSGSKAVAKWTAANPRHAAEFVLAQPRGWGTRSVAEVVGSEWAKTDPAGAIGFALANHGEVSAVIASQALKQWTEQNTPMAADWLTQADAATRNRLSPVLAAAWAKRDAPGALAWCEENLKGTALVQSVAGVMSGAAEKSVSRAGELVSSMEPSAARSEAAVAVAKKWFPQLSTATAVPQSAVEWLANLDAESARRALENVSWGWATSDPSSMAKYVGSADLQRVPTYAYTVLARELARNDPAGAMDWAARLPGAQALSTASEAFAEWRMAQPEAATEWLAGLSVDDPRKRPFLERTIRNMVYHPQAIDQLAGLRPADRDAARNVISSMELNEDRRATLLGVLK